MLLFYMNFYLHESHDIPDNIWWWKIMDKMVGFVSFYVFEMEQNKNQYRMKK